MPRADFRRDPRRARAARRGGACLLLAVGLVPRAARAEAATAGAAEAGRVATERDAALPAAPAARESSPLALRVTYHAPPACPSGSDFLGTLARHLAMGGEGAVDAEVSISERAGGGFELTLRQRVAGRESVSVTRAESCAALMQLAALNASMARLPDTLAGSLPVESPRSPVLAAPPPPASEPTASEPTAGASAAPRPPPALGLDAGEHGGSAEQVPRAPVRAFVLGELRAASGMLPQPAWGRGAALGAAVGPWSLRASLTWWQPQDTTISIDGGSPIAMKFTQQSLELAPCLGHALSPLLALHGCALFAGHRTASTAEPAQLAVSVGAGALAALSPWRGLRIEVQGGLQVVLGAPGFDADALLSIYRADTLQPTARIAIGWEFGADPPPPPRTDAIAPALAAPRVRDGGGV
jgi:hypothetical protein